MGWPGASGHSPGLAASVIAYSLSEGPARAAALSLLAAEDFALYHVGRQRAEVKECKDEVWGEAEKKAPVSVAASTHRLWF